MVSAPLPTVLRHLRRLVRPDAAGGPTDAQLLERFVGAGDEAAFELLVWRHGPMVLSVCRRLLRQAEDAEDAFQATFLVLVRKAASVRRGEAVGGFLYRVAYRVALAARARAARMIDHLLAEGGGDWISDIADALPMTVIGDIIGIPDEDRPRVFGCLDRILKSQAAGSQQNQKLDVDFFAWIFNYAMELTAEKRRNPTDDIWSTLASAVITARSACWSSTYPDGTMGEPSSSRESSAAASPTCGEGSGVGGWPIAYAQPSNPPNSTRTRAGRGWSGRANSSTKAATSARTMLV